MQIAFQSDVAPIQHNELSLGVALRVIWRHRQQILYVVMGFIGLGIVTALIVQPEFRSEARIMPGMNNGSGDMFKRLASVAGFAGMDFAEAEGLDAVRPDLYPNVLQSTPFILYLFNQQAITDKGKTTTIEQFLSPENNGWSLKKLFSWINPSKSNITPINTNNELLRLSAHQRDLADDLSERINARLDTRSGIITITATMPDANVAATVAHLGMTYLTQYVTNYRTSKARQDLQFYSQRLSEAKKRYQSAQFSVFQYNDRHKNYVVQAATIDKQQLEAELTISQSVYTELSRQYEQARLKVQERTPIFKVLEPAQIPLRRASPKRTMLVLSFAAAGLAISIIYVLIRNVATFNSIKHVIYQDQKV